MVDEMIYQLVDRTIKNMEKYNYDMETTHITMMTNINKYLHTFKAIDTQNMNLIKPSEKEMFLYMIYLLQKQKHNDLEALDSIQKIIDFKIDVHNGELVKDEIDALIDLYKTQIKLK